MVKEPTKQDSDEMIKIVMRYLIEKGYLTDFMVYYKEIIKWKSKK